MQMIEDPKAQADILGKEKKNANVSEAPHQEDSDQLWKLGSPIPLAMVSTQPRISPSTSISR